MDLTGVLHFLVLRHLPFFKVVAVLLYLMWPSAVPAADGTPAARYAVIVGVSGYTSPIEALPGAKNDVTLLVNTLLEQDVPRENMRVLADDLNNAFYQRKVKSDGTPTLKNILEGLDWLSTKATNGDHVTVYFSGHGSYLPELGKSGDKTEPDGFDEIFLPIDIKGMGDGEEEVINALRDDELATRLKKIASKGAEVWLIADACHSGTLSRGNFRTRGVDPVTQLGVPAARFDKAATPSRQQLAAQRGQRFVGFYAALPSMRAIEVPMPMGAVSNEIRPHGLMTWYLVQALRSGQSGSYGDIARFILAGYSQWGADAPVPLFEGNIDSRPPFSAAQAKLYSLSALRQQISVEAGLVDDLDVGSRLHILDLRTEPPAIVGSAAITLAGAERSLLGPVTGKTTASAISQSPQSFGARIDSKALPYQLRVALPTPPRAGASAADRTLAELARSQATAVLSAAPDQQMAAFEQAAPGQTPDVRLMVRHGRLWFAPPVGDFISTGGGQPFSLAADEVTAESINTSLAVIARGRNLLRVARLLDNTPVARAVRVQMRTVSQNPGPPVQCLPHQNGIHAGKNGQLRYDSAKAMPVTVPVKNCDVVLIRVTNTGRRMLDITPLYIDPWWRVTFVDDYPEGSYAGLRLDPGQTKTIAYTEFSAQTHGLVPTGKGSFLLIATEADQNASIAKDFRYLAFLKKEDTPRSAKPGSIDMLLSSAGFGGGAVRSAPALTDHNQAGAMIVHFETGK